MSKHIYGIHEWSDEVAHWLAERGQTGWWLELTHLAQDYNGRNLQRGHMKPVVRIQWGYSEGTIPSPHEYDEFARRAAEFVRNSQGIEYVHVGNEINIKDFDHPPSGPITKQQYTECYHKVYRAIKSVNQNIKIAPAPLATWTINPPFGWNDWITDMVDLFNMIGHDKIDWIALHAYSTSPDDSNFTEIKPMNAPFQHRSYSFAVLWEYIANIPQNLRHLPVMVTETNFNDKNWDNNTGHWIQGMFHHINQWNQNPNNQQILAAMPFRWNKDVGDGWDLSRSEKSKNDFRESLKHNYTHNYTGKAPQIEIKPTVGPNQGRIVAEAGLNVREAPGGRILTVAKYGDLVQVRGEKEGWLNVAYNGFVGWASAEYIER